MFMNINTKEKMHNWHVHIIYIQILKTGKERNI